MPDRTRAISKANQSGKYDDEYVDYVVKILQKCRDHKLYVFIDPHQDVVQSLDGHAEL
jgi:hypothetical protein